MESKPNELFIILPLPPFTSVIQYKDTFPTKRVPFADGEIKVGGYVERYLERRFGDYMQLPPEDKRHNHPPYIFDLGDC